MIMNNIDTIEIELPCEDHKARQLLRFRSYAKLTQKMLADKSGVSVRMIEQYEQGKKDLNHASAETVYKLSKALGCGMEELIEIDKIAR